MTLPASGALTFTAIGNELGVAPTGLTLGSASVRNLAGVPSGTITMNSLHGKSSASVVSSFNASARNRKANPGGTLTAGITLVNDGTINYTNSLTGSGTVSNQNPGWYSVQTSGIGTSYWAKVTSASSLGGSPLNSWIQISNSPTWTFSSPSSQDLTGSATVQISASAGGAVIATGTFSFAAGNSAL